MVKLEDVGQAQLGRLIIYVFHSAYWGHNKMVDDIFRWILLNENLLNIVLNLKDIYLQGSS